jgi:hypothetical protein
MPTAHSNTPHALPRACASVGPAPDAACLFLSGSPWMPPAANMMAVPQAADHRTASAHQLPQQSSQQIDRWQPPEGWAQVWPGQGSSARPSATGGRLTRECLGSRVRKPGRSTEPKACLPGAQQPPTPLSRAPPRPAQGNGILPRQASKRLDTTRGPVYAFPIGLRVAAHARDAAPSARRGVVYDQG